LHIFINVPLIFVHAFKICEISHIEAGDPLPPASISWKSRFPSDPLKAVFLLDTAASDKVLPLSFLEIDFSKVTRITALIHQPTQDIAGFEFFDGESIHCLGNEDPLVCKLSFYLEKGEQVAGFSYATLCGRLALQVHFLFCFGKLSVVANSRSFLPTGDEAYYLGERSLASGMSARSRTGFSAVEE
jgi:hypothetical protein